MKQSLLALTIASIFAAGAANAATVMKADNGDFLKIYGGAEVGGFLVSDKDKSPKAKKTTYVDKSFMTIGAKGQTEDVYFKFELDADRNDYSASNEMNLVIDKAYVGYEISKNQSVEFGRTDTAYDHYDGFGDFANELSAGVSEAGDQDDTLKYRAQFGDFKVGISHSLAGMDDKVTDRLDNAVTNGYVGYFTKAYTVLGGAEVVKDGGKIYSLHTEVNLGEFAVGGFVSSSAQQLKANDKMTYVASAKYAMTDKLTLLATMNMVDAETDSKDAKWVVIGGEYKYAKNIKLAAELAQGEVLKGGDTGTTGFAKVYYWF